MTPLQKVKVEKNEVAIEIFKPVRNDDSELFQMLFWKVHQYCI